MRMLVNIKNYFQLVRFIQGILQKLLIIRTVKKYKLNYLSKSDVKINLKTTIRNMKL